MTNVHVMDTKMRGGKERIEGRFEDGCILRVEGEGREGEQMGMIERSSGYEWQNEGCYSSVLESCR